MFDDPPAFPTACDPGLKSSPPSCVPGPLERKPILSTNFPEGEMRAVMCEEATGASLNHGNSDLFDRNLQHPMHPAAGGGAEGGFLLIHPAAAADGRSPIVGGSGSARSQPQQQQPHDWLLHRLPSFAALISATEGWLADEASMAAAWAAAAEEDEDEEFGGEESWDGIIGQPGGRPLPALELCSITP
jgi:hypothetical protein